MAENKTKPTQLSVTAFINAITDPARRLDAKTLVKMMQEASGEKPQMWGPSIIGFGSYHYKYESGREGDMPIVAFSSRKAATVLYGVCFTWMTAYLMNDQISAEMVRHEIRRGTAIAMRGLFPLTGAISKER